jgi:phosphopantothenoylcysteine decarboxylase/phosphopantothenate--cysteine ligase
MLIALGVSGGIAAYKACEIVRGLYKAGAEVQVILTRNGERFITPLTLQTLSGREVLTDAWDLTADASIRHIELTREIDALVVAPATANTIAKLARGVADDFLSTFYTAVTAPVVVAPAMNTRMWLGAANQENVATLRAKGVQVIEPESGWLAERESGQGRLAEPETIVEVALEAARRSSQLEGRTVLVTAGPTREAVDPVRYLSNRSSGKMGYALARVAAQRGARVILVSGPVSLAPPFGVEVVPVETTAQMRDAVMERVGDVDAVLMAAAVSDYAPVAASSKIKKKGESLTLELHEGPDILAELGADKGSRLLVGFAAETDDLERNARAKLERKNLDFIVANDVSREDVGFEVDHNAVTILGREGEPLRIPRASKLEIAGAILDHVIGPVTAPVGDPERG